MTSIRLGYIGSLTLFVGNTLLYYIVDSFEDISYVWGTNSVRESPWIHSKHKYQSSLLD